MVDVFADVPAHHARAVGVEVGVGLDVFGQDGVLQAGVVGRDPYVQRIGLVDGGAGGDEARRDDADADLIRDRLNTGMGVHHGVV